MDLRPIRNLIHDVIVQDEFTAGGTLEVGDLVYLDLADNEVKKVADNPAKITGVVMEPGTDGNAALVALLGHGNVFSVTDSSGSLPGQGDRIGISVESNNIITDAADANYHAYVLRVVNTTTKELEIIFPDAYSQPVNGGLAIRAGMSTQTGHATDIATGLTEIKFAVATIKGTTSGAGDAGVILVDHGADDKLDIYAFDDAGGEASNEANIYWIAAGTL